MSGASRKNFIMPAEYYRHEGTVVIFPERAGSWGRDPSAAQRDFAKVISAIAADERAFVIVNPRTRAAARKLLCGDVNFRNVTFFEIDSDDSWARDVAPTFVRDTSVGEIYGIDWNFNAWGGEVDGLYADWAKDNALAAKFCEMAGYKRIDARHFTLEGGSVHSDGEGTLMVTESCLLSAGRNPHMSKAEIERELCRYLGGDKVLWLPRGIYNDETNEHVDNVCAFLGAGEVCLAWTDDESDPQYPLSAACLEYLEGQTDARGRRLTVRKLPIPDLPVTVTAEDMDGYEFEDGEDIREVGEQLAASYVNFYFTNNSVLLPQFGGGNAESDERAVRLMSQWLPERRIVPIDARRIIRGGGNIHCITQQIPKRKEIGR